MCKVRTSIRQQHKGSSLQTGGQYNKSVRQSKLNIFWKYKHLTFITCTLLFADFNFVSETHLWGRGGCAHLWKSISFGNIRFFLLHWAATDMMCFYASLKAQLALGFFNLIYETMDYQYFWSFFKHTFQSVWII